MDEFEDHGFDFLPDQTELESNWDIYNPEFEDDFADYSQDHMRFLNNQDYSLNSPLIPDKLLDLKRFSTFSEDKKLRIPQSIKRAHQIFTQNVLSSSFFESDQDYHKTVHNLFIETGNDGPLWKNFLFNVNQDAKTTYPVLQAFVKGWINKNLIWRDHPLPDSESLFYSWGEIFYETHLLTLLINAKTEEEFQTVQELVYEKIGAKKDELPILGQFVVAEEFIFFPKYQLLVDREHLLMIKDTMIARCNTLLSIHNRREDFPKNMTSRMTNLYRSGDVIFIKHGNEGFNAIKLIEPFTTLKISEIAEELHPLYPKDLEFKSFVEKSIDDLKMAEANNFFRQIGSLTSAEEYLVVYGSFRHWGHPQIDYLEGLKKLHHQVNLPKEINQDYAGELASDLAYMVLDKMFKEKNTWFIDKSLIAAGHPFYYHIHNNTWPTSSSLESFGDHWHELPLLKCFDIPDMILPSIIYSDKSHSMNRSDVLNHVRNRNPGPIPAKRVLETYLSKKATNWKEFLKEVNDNGLSKEDLVIGLRGKEREIKIIGRFFALMSWKLREYFVATEYLIKEFYVPLFSGLTMADDLTRVIKKMLDSSQGQGQYGYQNMCISNHIDYEKWNNHQRYESTSPVFKVMGQFLGLPRLFERTHLFFQDSLVYYNGRPDLMNVIGSTLVNKYPDKIVCWNGQLGGLEGLRQKGWSVLNLLVINREAKSRNTAVKTLAQGDNQVICTQYETEKSRNEIGLQGALNKIFLNNQAIMTFIKAGTENLGLKINQSETLISTDLLIYGKVPIFRGSITSLTEKRWSRVTCMTNNQLPTMANIMATASTNALTVANFSYSPLNAMIFYNFAANMVRLLNEMHNPALRVNMSKIKDLKDLINDPRYKIIMAYLDPSLGGLSGLSLGRYLIRGFPDPITESLASWKLIYSHTSVQSVKDVALIAGNPEVSPFKIEDFDVLLENPMGLNIPRNVSINSLIRKEIKKNILGSVDKIKNKPIADCLKNYEEDSALLNNFLTSIRPIFPRFLSEFRDGSFVGIGDNLLGLFENAKTIRGTYQKKMGSSLDKKVQESELSSFRMIKRMLQRVSQFVMWNCSSDRADYLRMISWGSRTVGTTIPHPLELIVRGIPTDLATCHMCPSSLDNYLMVSLPKGLTNYKIIRGPYPPYLGSRTKESTSILQPWEKEARIPFFKKADNLRRSIGWFVKPNSNLALSICENLKSLSGEEWESGTEEYSRTGSALHRFACARQQAGGYCPISPAKFTWMIGTTDTLNQFKSDNYDFMYQSLLIYSQLTSGEMNDELKSSQIDHYHIKCKSCVRIIGDVWLDSIGSYKPKPLWSTLLSWIPSDVAISDKLVKTKVKSINWSTIGAEERSKYVGTIQGFLFGETTKHGGLPFADSDIFPHVLIDKLIPKCHLAGLRNGLFLSAALMSLSQSRVYRGESLIFILVSNFWKLLKRLKSSSKFTQYLRSKSYLHELCSVPHKVPASYPISSKDMMMYCENYFNIMTRQILRTGSRDLVQDIQELITFADTYVSEVVDSLSIAQYTLPLFFNSTSRQDETIRLFRECNLFLAVIKSKERVPLNEMTLLKGANVKNVRREVRHAMIENINLVPPDLIAQSYQWTMELIMNISSVSLTEDYLEEEYNFNQIQNPSISGLRLFQFATGSHYKLRSIIFHCRIPCSDFICTGDGSGGLTSCLLREFVSSRGIFNSLLDLTSVNLSGGHPEPPPAIAALGPNSIRCVNLDDCWENYSDLSDYRTWKYFENLVRIHDLKIDLIVLDFENRDQQVINQIELNLYDYGLKMLKPEGTIIYKSYGSFLHNYKKSKLPVLFSYFSTVKLVTTEMTSSQSSEFYYVAQGYQKGYKDMRPLWLPDRNKLNSLLYSEHSLISEFTRAKKIASYKERMYTGVPHNFRNDIESDLYSFIVGLTGYDLTASRICNHYATTLGKDVNFVFSLCVLLISKICNTTQFVTDEGNPPNDQIVKTMGCILSAFKIWYGLVTYDFVAWNEGLNMIQLHFPFSCEYIRQEKFDKWSLIWSVNRRYKIKKFLHLDSKMSLIGNLIRLFHNMKVNTNSSISFDKIKSNLVLYNRGLTIKHLTEATGVFDYPLWDDKLARDSLYPRQIEGNSWDS